jgi:hypothetical protein
MCGSLSPSWNLLLNTVQVAGHCRNPEVAGALQEHSAYLFTRQPWYFQIFILPFGCVSVTGPPDPKFKPVTSFGPKYSSLARVNYTTLYYWWNPRLKCCGPKLVTWRLWTSQFYKMNLMAGHRQWFGNCSGTTSLRSWQNNVGTMQSKRAGVLRGPFHVQESTWSSPPRWFAQWSNLMINFGVHADALVDWVIGNLKKLWKHFSVLVLDRGLKVSVQIPQNTARMYGSDSMETSLQSFAGSKRPRDSSSATSRSKYKCSMCGQVFISLSFK